METGRVDRLFKAWDNRALKRCTGRQASWSVVKKEGHLTLKGGQETPGVPGLGTKWRCGALPSSRTFSGSDSIGTVWGGDGGAQSGKGGAPVPYVKESEQRET